MKTARLFLLLTLLAVNMALHATTLKWLARPQYDRIGFYSETIFKCEKDGKVQLIDFEGKALLPFAVDSVTDFSNGYALLLDKEGKKWRVKGVLGEKYNDCQTVDGEFYTERYTYCSEGFISVANAKGKQGYINVKGYPVIRCEFREARPFREGWASVSEKEGEAHYIDSYGDVLHVNVKLTDASSFNDNGEALVGNYQKLLILDTNGEVVRNYKMKNGQTVPPVRPYDYVYDENWRVYKPEHNKKPIIKSHYNVFANNGYYGIEDGNSVVSIAQFNEIQCIADQFAIVRTKQQWGVVGYLDEDIRISITPSAISIVPGRETEDCLCTFDVPKTLDSALLVLDSGEGTYRILHHEERPIRFKPYVKEGANSCTIRARAIYQGLFVWDYEMTLPVKYAKMKIAVGKPYCTSQYANENDLQRVRATITNHSTFPVDVSAAVESLLPVGSKNTVASWMNPRKTLQPEESMECYITFKVVEEEKVRIVVSATGDGSACGKNETIITLIPFY